MPKIDVEETALVPFWQTTDGEAVRLYQGDVRDVLARLPAKSVHCCVTSPPYWGLRDYGTAEWVGGDPDCNHDWGRKNDGHVGKSVHKDGHKSPFRGTAIGSAYLDQGKMSSMSCLNGCGARRVDQQIGSEPSPDCGTQGKAQCGRCFVCAMVGVFREIRRVLRDDGTLWLNLGDSYNANTGSGESGTGQIKAVESGQARDTNNGKSGLKSGNLVGVPWRVALALQTDGWVLRQDIIWHKPSPMPESVRNRCTKAHEYVFLLTKSMKYFYDAEAIKEKAKQEWNSNGAFAVEGGKNESMAVADPKLFATRGKGTHHPDVVQSTSNKRSVWSVSSQGYEGAHFATFPPKLIEPMIKAGTSEKGCCVKCGAPWRRVVEEKALRRERPNEYTKRVPVVRNPHNSGLAAMATCGNGVAGVEVKTIGWEPSCSCGEADVVPCTVLDPFCGSGTTSVVAIDLGLRSIGIDLSAKYLENNAKPRIEGALLARPAIARLAGKGPKKITW